MTLLLVLAWSQSVDELIERMGDESIDVRVEAEELLRSRGRAVLPALREAQSRHSDSEVRGRAEELIRYFCRIPWQDDLQDAILLAAREGKPLFVFLGDPDGGRFPVPWEDETLIDILRDRFILFQDATGSARRGRVLIFRPDLQELSDPGNPEPFLHELIRVAGRERVAYRRDSVVAIFEQIESHRILRDLRRRIREHQVTLSTKR